MQRASAVFGVLIFVLWLAVLAVGVAYVTVWAATRRRPQWRFLAWFSRKPDASSPPRVPSGRVVTLVASPEATPVSAPTLPSAEIIPFQRPTGNRARRA